MAAEDPRTRASIARLGAHALHAQHSGVETTAAARSAFLRRFEAQVDPDGVLEPAERAHRAEHARKAHFTKMALRSAQARRLKSGRWQVRAKATAE